jgi:hypothetical protein
MIIDCNIINKIKNELIILLKIDNISNDQIIKLFDKYDIKYSANYDYINNNCNSIKYLGGSLNLIDNTDCLPIVDGVCERILGFNKNDIQKESNKYLQDNKVSEWIKCHTDLGVGISNVTQENTISITTTQKNSCLISNLIKDEELNKNKNFVIALYLAYNNYDDLDCSNVQDMNKYLNDNINQINECFNKTFIIQKNILKKCFVNNTQMKNIANIDQTCIIKNINTSSPNSKKYEEEKYEVTNAPTTSPPSRKKYYILGIIIFICILYVMFLIFISIIGIFGFILLKK